MINIIIIIIVIIIIVIILLLLLFYYCYYFIIVIIIIILLFLLSLLLLSLSLLLLLLLLLSLLSSLSLLLLFQVLIQVPQKGSVITWDFDILKGDVTFTVLRCRQHPTAEPHEHHISGAVGGIGSKQYIDKHTVVGVDVSIVEAPTVCRDGDSVQVSDFLNQEVLTHPWKTVRYDAMVSHRSLSRFVAHCCPEKCLVPFN